jgi:hypothetical protein
MDNRRAVVRAHIAFAHATLWREREALGARRFIDGTENMPECVSNNKMQGLRQTRVQAGVSPVIADALSGR